MSGPVAITVIMPVYNSEKYLEQAVNSVLSQDFDSFELLMIDDGSTDSSGAICDTFAQRDGRVRVFHIENAGMCHARNFALGKARGEYVTFCDNDDECLQGFLRENYEMAKRHDADIVRFGRRTETTISCSDTPEVVEYAPKEEQTLIDDDVYTSFSSLMYGSNGVWTGLYRRDLLLKHRLQFIEELRRGCEDKIFNLDAYDHARTVCLNPGIYYVWRRRIGHSSSMEFDDNYYLGMGLYLHRVKGFMLEHGINKSDASLYMREMLAPFREMVGAWTRSGVTDRAANLEFCRKVRTIYEGYWVPSNMDLRVPQSVVLTILMRGNYALAASIIRGWRVRMGERFRRGRND